MEGIETSHTHTHVNVGFKNECDSFFSRPYYYNQKNKKNSNETKSLFYCSRMASKCSRRKPHCRVIRPGSKAKIPCKKTIAINDHGGTANVSGTIIKATYYPKSACQAEHATNMVKRIQDKVRERKSASMRRTDSAKKLQRAFRRRRSAGSSSSAASSGGGPSKALPFFDSARSGAKSKNVHVGDLFETPNGVYQKTSTKDGGKSKKMSN